jgi:hypothetical protein
MKRDTCRQNSRTFLAKFLPGPLLDISAATRAENSGGWIGNDYNSDSTLEQKMAVVLGTPFVIPPLKVKRKQYAQVKWA